MSPAAPAEPGTARPNVVTGPPAPLTAPPAPVLRPIPEMRSLRGLSNALTAMLIVAIALPVTITIFAGVYQAFGNSADLYLAVGALGALASFGVAIATVIVWLVWQFRATRNAEVLGGRSRWTAGSVFLLLVPLLNIAVAPALMLDLWRRSSPDTGTKALPIAWWALYFAPSALVNPVLWIGMSAAGISFTTTFYFLISAPPAAFTLLSMISLVFGIPAAIVTIVVVRRISDRQRETFGPAANVIPRYGTPVAFAPR